MRQDTYWVEKELRKLIAPWLALHMIEVGEDKISVSGGPGMLVSGSCTRRKALRNKECE